MLFQSIKRIHYIKRELVTRLCLSYRLGYAMIKRFLSCVCLTCMHIYMYVLGQEVKYLTRVLINRVCEKRRLWRDCADAQARPSLRCPPIR